MISRVRILSKGNVLCTLLRTVQSWKMLVPRIIIVDFECKASTGGFTPDRVAVFCKCEMPYNPDDIMVQCETCKDWHHPFCVDMTIEQAKKLECFVCSECTTSEGQNGFHEAAADGIQIETKRRKS